MQLKGLPAGVDVVRFGIADPTEFEIMIEAGVAKITKGPRAGSQTQVIVQPLDGYAFHFDARQFCYVPVKLLTAPVSITAVVKFEVANSMDHDGVQAALAALKDVPGFKELTSS